MELRDWRIATLEIGDPRESNWHVGFMSQKNWATSKLGKRFSYFTYAAILYDRGTGRIYQQSSQVLNHNGMVRVLSIRHKDNFDRSLGGLNN